MNQNKNKQIVFLGTNDHTFFLMKFLVKKFNTKNFRYFEIEKRNDFFENRKTISLKKIKKIDALKKYDYVVISSFEYQSSIKDKIKNIINNKKIFEIYDTSSRSIIDSYYIKNIYTNKKLLMNGPKTKIF